MPIAVQRKELHDAQSLYGSVREAIESGHPKVLDLSCEKDEHKQISLLSNEILAVQLYEKSAMGAGNKRPGFSVDS